MPGFSARGPRSRARRRRRRRRRRRGPADPAGEAGRQAWSGARCGGRGDSSRGGRAVRAAGPGTQRGEGWAACPGPRGHCPLPHPPGDSGWTFEPVRRWAVSTCFHFYCLLPRSRWAAWCLVPLRKICQVRDSPCARMHRAYDRHEYANFGNEETEIATEVVRAPLARSWPLAYPYSLCPCVIHSVLATAYFLKLPNHIVEGMLV